MKELSAAEISLIENSPKKYMNVVRDSLNADLAATAKKIMTRPSRIKGVKAKNIEEVVAELERIGGCGAARAALLLDKRKASQRLLEYYPASVETTRPDGTPLTTEELIGKIESLGSREVRAATRDLLMRIDPAQSKDFIEKVIAATMRSGFTRGIIAQEWFASALNTKVDLNSLEPTTIDYMVSAASGFLNRYDYDILINVLERGQDRRAIEAVFQLLWTGNGGGLAKKLNESWRKGNITDEFIENQAVAVIAGHGFLNKDELFEQAPKFGSYASIVLKMLKPQDVIYVLRNLPPKVALRSVDEILQSSAAMETEAVCEVVKRGRSYEISRWMRGESSRAALAGTSGVEIIKAILDNWERDNIVGLCNEISEQQHYGDRPDLEYLALNAPAIQAVLTAGGTIGRIGRQFCYESLGEDRRAWDYLKGLLPAWTGSLNQVVRAAKTMARAR